MLDRPELQRILDTVGRRQPASFFESQRLDFKQPARSAKETLALLADAAVCFANAEGGTIVLGVNDKATARSQALVGADSISVDQVRAGIFQRTQPALTPFVSEIEQEGVRLVIIDVPAGVEPCSNSAGLATRRVGKDCLPFTPDQQREMKAARGQLDWSADPSGVDIQQLASLEVDRMRRLLRDGGDEELARLRDEALLQALRLIAADGTATNAALLLLGSETDLATKIPAYGYSYQFRPTAGSEAISRFRGQAPLLAAVELVLDAVERRIELRPLNVAGGVQVELFDYPLRAVRELVVNAFIHRTYHALGSVDIEHTPERLVVTSPGGFVVGVTPSNILTQPSTPRYRLLTETVAACHLAERTGQGIDRAYREMLRLGKSPPEFEDTGALVRGILSGGIGNDAFARFVSDLPPELSGDVEVLLVLSLLRDKSSVDAKRAAAVIQRNVLQAQDVLARLAEGAEALLEPTRSSVRRQFPVYRLRPDALAGLARAVSYRRRTVDQIDEKVIEHIREYGFVTNRTLQRMFDMHVFAARNLLTDLRERGLVSKIGDARGGPGVRYGPGRKFPK